MRMRKGTKEDVWKDERVGAGGKKDCEEGKKKELWEKGRRGRKIFITLRSLPPTRLRFWRPTMPRFGRLGRGSGGRPGADADRRRWMKLGPEGDGISRTPGHHGHQGDEDWSGGMDRFRGKRRQDRDGPGRARGHEDAP